MLIQELKETLQDQAYVFQDVFQRLSNIACNKNVLV